MNIRKLKRAKSKLTLPMKMILVDMNINETAKNMINAATNGEEKIESLGNFIFFSAHSGEAWILDHRESLALRLADNFEPLPYTIIETTKQFYVEWKEKFHIADGTFIAINGGNQSTFFDYPVEKLQYLIDNLRE